MKLERFEDLVAWQEARASTREIYRDVRELGDTLALTPALSHPTCLRSSFGVQVGEGARRAGEGWLSGISRTAQYGLTATPPLNRDFGLRDQIRRAAVSVMSNTAEGFERTGRREKLQFMNIARASRAEVKSLLYVGLDNQFLEPTYADRLQSRCSHISRLLSGLIRSVRDRATGSSSSTDSDSEH